MKRTKIIYWIFTALLAALMLFSGITGILLTPESIDLITTHLGYPTYFIQLIGLAKVLGAVAILIPGFPTIKEWAYAGFTFDLIGAIYSSIAVGDSASSWMPMFIFILILAGSYVFYHKKLSAEIHQQ